MEQEHYVLVGNLFGREDSYPHGQYAIKKGK